MRILLANYRYFVSGGPERYLFGLSEELSSRSHAVIPFSIRYTANRLSPYSQYFVEPLGSPDEVYYRDQRPTARTLWRTLARLFYARDVEQAVVRIVRGTSPDIAYILHYLRKLSPSLLVGLKKQGVPIVVRLSDYGMICPEAHCLRDSQPCELCVRGDLLHSIRYRCIQGSSLASLANAIATWYHRYRRYFDLIDCFIVTHPLMFRMMANAGVTEDRLRYLPTFVDGGTFRPLPSTSKRDVVVFTGRLEAIKGVHVLIEAVKLLSRTRPDVSWHFEIAGVGDKGYADELRHAAEEAGLRDKVQFVGNLDVRGIARLLSGARIAVVPSLWYENLPNALLESYACGTPVIASALGSLKDAVVEGETGFLFPRGDAVQLSERLSHCWDHREQIDQMSAKARRVAETTYSAEVHLQKLLTLFSELLDRNPQHAH